jgi:fructokinase
MDLYGGLETGGTTWCAVVGTGPDDVRDTAEWPIGVPDETIGRAIDFFSAYAGLAGVGIGSFGPVDRDRRSAQWGHITTTPKPGWAFVDLAGPIADALGVPIGFDTDVNAAAVGEYRWGAAQDVDTFCYLTVGTGIGGGVLVDGRPLGGLLHPEFGPYHGDCWEGLASATAMRARWQAEPHELPDDHPGWDVEAEDLALGLANVVYLLSPQRIVLGGGVMRRAGLHDRVRARLPRILNDYLASPAFGADIEAFVCPPGLGGRSGSLGALALGQDAAAAG